MRSETAIGPEPGPPPPWGCVNDLCRLKWTMSKPMSPGREMPMTALSVRAVVVERAARLVDDLGDLLDLRVEDPQRVGVGEHQAGGVVAGLRPQVVEVDAAVGVRRDLDDLQAGHRHRRRVRAVRGVGRQHLGAVRLAPVGVVGLASAARRRARRASRRTAAARRAAGPATSASARSRFHISSSAPWARVGSCSGCSRAWPGSAGDPLVQARVVLHRARAERVEAASRGRSSSSTASRSGGRARARRPRAAAAARCGGTARAARRAPRARRSRARRTRGGPGAPFSKIVTTGSASRLMPPPPGAPRRRRRRARRRAGRCRRASGAR